MNEIASAVTYRDYILIFMCDGRIYKMAGNIETGNFTYCLIDKFEPR